MPGTAPVPLEAGGYWLVVRSAGSEISQLFKAILDHLRDALLKDGAFPAQALIAILLLMSSLVRSHTLGDLARVVRKFLRLGDGQFPMWDLPVDPRAGASSFAAYIP